MRPEDRRVIWLLVRRLGGEVTLTEEELTGCPDLPALGAMNKHGGLWLLATAPPVVVQSGTVAGEIEAGHEVS